MRCFRQAVPDFALTDQNRHHVALSQFAGKVVAINFIYTSCVLPNFCCHNSNTFGVLQKRFKQRMGRDLVLLTVTFDRLRYQPDVLARYARTWKADPETWRFRTGPVPDVQRVIWWFRIAGRNQMFRPSLRSTMNWRATAYISFAIRSDNPP